MTTTDVLIQRFRALPKDKRAALVARLERRAADLGRYRPAPIPETRVERVRQALTGPRRFVEIYLSEYLYNGTPGFHLDLYNLMTGGWREENPEARGVVVAAPRGHAKSTIVAFATPMWWIYAKIKRFIVLISDTNDLAIALAENIRREIEENELLAHDFGNICGDRRGMRRPLRWTQKDFITYHPDGFTTRVVARGTGASFRGLRMRAHRPDAIIADDLENDRLVETQEQRDKIWRWVMRAVLPMLDPVQGEIFFIGTILHYDSVLQRLLNQGRDDGIYVWRKLQAILPDGQSLWPTRFTLRILAALKKQMGSPAFNQEMMNEPLGPEDRVFQPSWFRWYDRGELSYSSDKETWFWRDKPLKIFGGVDLAISEAETADYFAYLILGITPDQEIILIYAWHDRISFPEQVRELIHVAKNFPLSRLAVEVNAYQLALAQQLLISDERMGRILKRVKQPADKSKFTRLVALAPLFENGLVYFPLAPDGQPGEVDLTGAYRMLPWAHPVYQEFIQFPKSAHDDYIDAFEMASSAGVKRRRGFEGFF